MFAKSPSAMTATPFEVERLRESLDRLLLAMSALLKEPDAEELPAHPVKDISLCTNVSVPCDK